MTKKEQIITKYLERRQYKRVLVITKYEQSYLKKINTLRKLVCSGYLKIQKQIGCIFDVSAWPFDHKFFDLIIVDNSFIDSTKQTKNLLNQLYFCLADDGEVIVACSENIRLYRLLSKFLSQGFISKKTLLINTSSSKAINMFRLIVTKNFIAIFRKDNIFTVNHLQLEDLVKNPVKSKVYSSGCAKEIYGNFEKK